MTGMSFRLKVRWEKPVIKCAEQDRVVHVPQAPQRRSAVEEIQIALDRVRSHIDDTIAGAPRARDPKGLFILNRTRSIRCLTSDH
jgi:hypothetical protein